MFQVSFYKNIADTTSKEVIKIESFLKAIKTGKYKKQIDQLRQANTKSQQSDLKKQLPNITSSGTFSKRIDSALINHSTLKQIDFDKDKNPDMDPWAAKKVLSNDKFTFAAFISPTGTGVKLLVRIEPDQDKEVYNSLQEYYSTKYKLLLDSSCSNVSRAMFVSMDNDLYENFDSVVFAANKDPLKIPLRTISSRTGHDKQKEVELLISKIEASKTDITDEYRQWVNIGFAIASEFGLPGESFFHRISSLSPKYKEADCRTQYKECCKGRKSGIAINTLFSIAKGFNIYAREPIQNGVAKSKDVKSAKNLSNKESIVFYTPVLKNDEDNNQVLKDIKINYVKFVDLIYSFGFRRFDIDKDFIYIRLQENVIKEVTVLQIQDYFFTYLESLPDQLSNNVTKKQLKEKMYNNPKNYFCDNRLSLLVSKDEIFFNADTKNECFIYYKNGFVVCNKDAWHLKPYNELRGFIWYNQIINREFTYQDIPILEIKKCSVYAQFLYNVSDKDNSRFNSLCSLTGYLLHSFTEVKMKAVILTDSRISEEANGRTGKTLFGQTLGKIKKLTQVNGKDFDPTQRYKYQDASLDTQIIFLNDVRNNFKFEVLYNDITEGITVEKKHQNPFLIKTKMCITTNKTIAIEGSSSRDRSIEFEFANHYSERYSPENEFQHRFFHDWDKYSWMQFDNFMMFCISLYLDHGIIEPKNNNLNHRKLLDQTHPYFLEFIREKITEGEIVADKEICKQELHSQFLNEYKDFQDDKFKKRLELFTKWLKVFAKYAGIFSDEVVERKSGDKRYFIFASIK
ncbi:MAG: BT4734/BF3469 family protein [Ferruginibacter sp.]